MKKYPHPTHSHYVIKISWYEWWLWCLFLKPANKQEIAKIKSFLIFHQSTGLSRVQDVILHPFLNSYSHLWFTDSRNPECPCCLKQPYWCEWPVSLISQMMQFGVNLAKICGSSWNLPIWQKTAVSQKIAVFHEKTDSLSKKVYAKIGRIACVLEL